MRIALAPVLLALVSTQASAGTLVAGDYLRAYYGSHGLWNSSTDAAGLQMNVSATWWDISYPITPWVNFVVEYDESGNPRSYVNRTDTGASGFTDRRASNTSFSGYAMYTHEWQAGSLNIKRYELWDKTGRTMLVHLLVTNDGVVPRHKLTEIMSEIYRIGRYYQLRIANLCHAGDGNIHPLILYNPGLSGDAQRAVECSVQILRTCLDFGGSLTGEHGIGEEKKHLLPAMYSELYLNYAEEIRKIFNPNNLANPGKIFPGSGGCGELRPFINQWEI